MFGKRSIMNAARKAVFPIALLAGSMGCSTNLKQTQPKAQVEAKAAEKPKDSLKRFILEARRIQKDVDAAESILVFLKAEKAALELESVLKGLGNIGPHFRQYVAEGNSTVSEIRGLLSKKGDGKRLSTLCENAMRILADIKIRYKEEQKERIAQTKRRIAELKRRIRWMRTGRYRISRKRQRLKMEARVRSLNKELAELEKGLPVKMPKLVQRLEGMIIQHQEAVEGLKRMLADLEKRQYDHEVQSRYKWRKTLLDLERRYGNRTALGDEKSLKADAEEDVKARKKRILEGRE